MATSNFITQDDFPLYVMDDPTYLVCSACGEVCEEGEDCCPICGESLSTCFDDLAAEELIDEMKTYIGEANEQLTAYEIQIKSGYYTGLQLYVVELLPDPSDYPDFDNSDAHYYFDMCLSKAKRFHAAQKRKTIRLMDQIASQMGMDKLGIYARFSNGETWYTKTA